MLHWTSDARSSREEEGSFYYPHLFNKRYRMNIREKGMRLYDVQLTLQLNT